MNLNSKNITNHDAFRLAERAIYGNTLEKSSAHVEATLLTFEDFNKFIEIIGQKEYFDWITQRLRIHLNREKLAPYLECGLISGDFSEDFFIAHLLSYYSKEVIDKAIAEGSICPKMSFLEINDFFYTKFPKKYQRTTKKVKEDNQRMVLLARYDFLKNQKKITRKNVFINSFI